MLAIAHRSRDAPQALIHLIPKNGILDTSVLRR